MKFSIVTPCFNSAKILERTYESLLKIESNNFEWILVDDASSDNGETIKLMREIEKNAPFLVKIVLLKKNYYGSKSAYEGALVADGSYICILDHDDLLLPNALAIVEIYIKKHAEKPAIAGVAGRCVDQKGRLIGGNADIEFVGTEGDLRFKKRFPYEIIQFTRREIILEYFEKMKPGYTNGFAWAAISSKYKWVYINSPLRVYDNKYEHSFTNSEKIKITYPTARAEAIEISFLQFDRYYLYNLHYSLRFIGSAIRYKLHSKIGIKKMVGHTLIGSLIYCTAIPFGVLRYLADIYLKNNKNK